jgi:hypothetical protein
MRLKAVVCVFIGHRWVQPPDPHEAYPGFECRRCGRREEFAQGTGQAGFEARLGAETQRDKSRIG